MSVGVYLRVSTKSQSSNPQRHAVELWAAERGYEKSTMEWYVDEGVSGSLGHDSRAGYARLRDGVAVGRLKTVIIFDPSRVSRNYLEYLKFLELCEKKGCVVEVVGEGAVKFGKSADKLMASILAYASEAEREKHSDRISAGMAAAKARGIRVGAPKGHKSRRGYRKHYPEELISEVLRLRRLGLTQTEIGRIAGNKYGTKPLTQTVVCKILRRNEGRKKTVKTAPAADVERDTAAGESPVD